MSHYFHANFITAYNQQATTPPEVLATGITLLRAVNAAPTGTPMLGPPPDCLTPSANLMAGRKRATRA